MKKVYLVLCTVLFFLTGCSSYKDVNLTMFSVLTLVDIDDSNHPVVYMELFRSVYDQEVADEKGERIVLSGTGETVAEAFAHVNHKASYQINGAHNKLLMFTDRAAKHGLEDYLDFFSRDQEYLLRQFIMIYEGDPMVLLNMNIEQERYIGLFFEQLLKNKLAIADKKPIRLFEYMNLRTIGAKTAVLDLVSVKDNIIIKEEAAVIMADKMIGKLSEEELIHYHTMMTKTNEGYITVPHPKISDKVVSLEIIKRRVMTDIVDSGNQEDVVILKKYIKFKLSFEETQDSIDLTDAKIRSQIIETVKKKVVEDSQKLYEQYKKKNIDIFGVEEAYNRKYPHGKKQDLLGITQLEIKVDVYLEGSPDTQSFTK